jgi:hypothetical protein
MGKIIDTVEVICVCPTRNEEWIIGFFCDQALRWADKVIVLDQHSTDKTVEICKAIPDVHVFENNSKVFNEDERQKQLISLARKLRQEKQSKLLIMALDADEFLDPSFPSEREKVSLKTLPEGTTCRFDWRLVSADRTRYRSFGPTIFGYIDDGVEHTPARIHSIRVPVRDNSSIFDFPDTANYHLQNLNASRQAMKLKWYQSLEIYKHRQDPVTTFRQYNTTDEFFLISEELDNKIVMTTSSIKVDTELTSWWYDEILTWLESSDGELLKYADIWDEDWDRISNAATISKPTVYHRLLLKWLKRTQKRRGAIWVRIVDKLLRLYFCRTKEFQGK